MNSKQTTLRITTANVPLMNILASSTKDFAIEAVTPDRPSY